MHCPRCGETNHDEDRFCSYCGQDLATYRRLWPRPDVPPPTPPAPQPLATSVSPPADGEGAPGAHVAPDAAAPVPSHLGWAASLLACFWPAWPAGVVAVAYATRSESRFARGDLAGARESSRKAWLWCWVTCGAGSILWTVALILIVRLSA